MPGMPLRPCALRTASQLLAAKSLLLCSLVPARRAMATSPPLLQEPKGGRSVNCLASRAHACGKKRENMFT